MDTRDSGRLFLLSAGQNRRVRDISRGTSSRRRRGQGGLREEREAPDPEPVGLDYDDGAGGEGIGDRGQVRDQERYLLAGSALCSAAEQDHGWLRGAPLGEEGAEVGVGGDDDPAFGGDALEDLNVGGGLERVLTNVYCVMAGGGQTARRRDARARCRSELSTGGCEGQLTLPNCLSRVSERFADILELEVRERIEDLGRAHPVSEHADDCRNRNPEPADAWHPVHLARVDGDSAERHPLSAYRRLFSHPASGYVAEALVRRAESRRSPARQGDRPPAAGARERFGVGALSAFAPAVGLSTAALVPGREIARSDRSDRPSCVAHGPICCSSIFQNRAMWRASVPQQPPINASDGSR